MDGLLADESEGEVRSGPAKISGSVYTPSGDPEVLETMLNLVALTSSKILHPLERSFYLFANVSYLQAFRDGNKRTARLLSNVPLIGGELIPHPFQGVEEDDYLMAIVYYYETGDSAPLAYLWADSYFIGIDSYGAIEENYESENLAKVELASEKCMAVRFVVANKTPRSDITKVAEKVWRSSKQQEKYRFEEFLAILITALDKLARTKIGGHVFGLSEQEIDDFADHWR